MNRKLAVALLLAAAALVAGSGRVAAQAPLEFNYGYTTADHVNLYVAQDLNLFEKVGLKPKFFTFQSGAPLLRCGSTPGRPRRGTSCNHGS